MSLSTNSGRRASTVAYGTNLDLAGALDEPGLGTLIFRLLNNPMAALTQHPQGIENSHQCYPYVGEHGLPHVGNTGSTEGYKDQFDD